MKFLDKLIKKSSEYRNFGPHKLFLTLFCLDRDESKGKFEFPSGLTPTVGRMMGVSCTYFQALPKYIPHLKYISNFMPDDNDPIAMEFTIQSGNYKYLEHEDFHWIEMPYQNEQLSLCMLLPKPDKNARDILENLTVVHFSDIISSTTEITANLHLPPVRLVWNFDMAMEMQLSGIQKIFEKDAELARMAKNYKSLHCDSVLVNLDFCLMNLNKTNIALITESMLEKRPQPGKEIKVNVPFIYYLTYGKTVNRVIIFAGCVNRIEL